MVVVLNVSVPLVLYIINSLWVVWIGEISYSLITIWVGELVFVFFEACILNML